MRKLFFLLCFSAFNVLTVCAQTDTTVLTGESATALFKEIGMDSITFLKQVSKDACLCIDSVDNTEKVKSKKIEAFSACIDKEVNAYQLAVKLLNSMKAGSKKNEISIASKNSSEYKHYYYDIERWLLDSCTTLKRAIASNDEEREKSLSDNTEAMEAYNKGVALLKKEKYEDCIPFFEKAVSIDPEFAFAWDNLGICYRRTNKLDKAVTAYKASLKVDPAGKTPLQNLAVVYMMQNKDDDAISTYNEILKYYPDEVEVYYGISMVYLNNKKDMENALQNMCKAYNLYIKLKSPYRSDAEKVINMIYAQMKKEGKEEKFQSILKENNIKSN